MAQAINGELFVVYVDTGVDDDDPERQRSLQANLHFAENLGATIVRLKGKDVAQAMAEFVREKHITQMIFGHSATSGWRKYLFMSAVHRFLRDAPAVDVHIVKAAAQLNAYPPAHPGGGRRAANHAGAAYQPQLRKATKSAWPTTVKPRSRL